MGAEDGPAVVVCIGEVGVAGFKERNAVLIPRCIIAEIFGQYRL